MSYINAGKADGGTYTMPSTRGGQPIMTFDAAGIASGGAFLVSELEKRDVKIREPLTSVTYPRDINVNVGGGWVDYVSALSVQYGVTGGSENGPVQAGGANGTPMVQASFDKGSFKAHEFSVGFRIKFSDMQKSILAGHSLDQALTKGVRLTYDKHMDANVYIGLSQFGTTGLINNPDATETTVNNGAAGTATWVTKTPDEILTDINSALTSIWAANGYSRDAIPNHILLPYEQYTYILTQKVNELGSETIMDYVLRNNIASKELGDANGLYIGGVAWCKGAGTGSKDRMVVYVNHEDFVNVDELVPLTRSMTGPVVNEGCYDTLYMANISETQIYYTTAIGYFDGI